MNINNIYIDNNLINIIYCNLSNKSKINFHLSNKYIYNMYHSNIKYLIYDYINIDYLKFRLFLLNNNYSSSDITNLGIVSVSNIPNVWKTEHISHYDIRFLFELVYKNLNINDKYIINNAKNSIILMFLKKIKKCLYINRYETMINIYKEPMLGTLHPLFNGYLKGNIEWTPILI